MATDLDDQHQSLIYNETHFHEKTKNTQIFLFSCAKWVLKFTMCVVFVAWITLFFLVPWPPGADFYDDMVDATDTTIFGKTGCALLFYSGPVFVIAILAIPYLLISRGEEEHLQERKKNPKLRLWTFPVLVDGPFGVVSAAEMIGIILFPVFVVWAVYEYTLANFSKLASYGDLTTGEKRLFMLQMSAYRFGLITLSCFAFLFLPIARGSILLRLIGIPFDHATKYHIWLGNLVMFLGTIHGLCYSLLWIFRGILLKELVEWKSDGVANFAGVICYCFGLVMWVTTIPPIRKKYFELFFYTHQLYIFFVIFLALHIGSTNFSKVAGGIFLFMLDRFLRFCQSRRTVDVIPATSFSCGAVKLVVSKPENLQYNALGFIFIRIRELSQLQWHPFSILSSPLDGKNHLSVLIKVVGEWTTRLQNISTEEYPLGFSSNPHSNITASVEGPYGHESPYHLMYKNLILVAGGSGISPILAILGDIFHRLKGRKPCLPKNILVIWAVKKSNELSLLSAADMDSIYPLFLDELNLEIQAYVTRELEPPPEGGENGNTVRSFTAPTLSGRAMSILVGTGDIIWPGIYVISATSGLIILVALLDIYYINPFSITAWWYKGLLFLTCMVASVIIFGGTVIGLWHLWERRFAGFSSIDDRYHDEEPITTPTDVLEKQLASSTTVLYGCRPDFKEIFESVTKRWGYVDIGVIVCGPSSIQSSVATQCRSFNIRRGSNLPIFHFNSHSFDL